MSTEELIKELEAIQRMIDSFTEKRRALIEKAKQSILKKKEEKDEVSK